MVTIRSAVMDIGEPRQLVLPCPYCGDNKVVMARQIKKEEVETNPIFAEFLDYSGNGASPPTRWQSFKTFYDRNLRIFVIS